MKPALSVVMACRDMACYLEGAIRSVVAQSFADWELWIVDDGSADHPLAIVDIFADDPRIRFVRTERRGQSFAKSLGVRLARAEWIAFLDADDVWDERKLEVQLNAAAAEPEFAIWCSGRFGLHPNDHIYEGPKGEITRESLFERNPICFSSSLIHRRVFDHIGLFHPTIDRSIDYDFWLRAACSYRFGYVDQPLVGYRTGHANLSANKLARMEAVLRITEENLRYGMRTEKKVRRKARSSTWKNIGYFQRGKNAMRALSAYWKAFCEEKRIDRLLRSILASAFAGGRR